MTIAVDEYPLRYAAPEIRDLLRILAQSIWRESELEEVVTEAGISPSDIAWNPTPRLTWRSVFGEASSHGRMRALLAVVVEKKPLLAERMTTLVAAEPATTATIPASAPERIDAASPEWRNFTAGGHEERQIVEGQPTFVDIAFLELGLARAASVCRLSVTFGGGREVRGTAFAIAPSALLTNHHMLYDWDHGASVALAVEAWFDYESMIDGTAKPTRKFSCAVASIVGERAHDWAVILTDEPVAPKYPPISLAPPSTLEVNDRVYIIQHPDGLRKKIALHHNLVRHVDEDVVQYWADTEEGSSGAPVFNESWELVALHHQWVESPAGDGTQYRNQGRRIGRVLERIQASGASLGI